MMQLLVANGRRYAFFGNDLAADSYQNFMAPQPTAVGLT